MAALGSQSIASSYEQLLHVDRDGGGNTTTHVSVKDGDNGTTFGFTIASDALMMSSTNRLEFGDTGTYIHQSADGVLDLVSDTEIEINATTIDMNGAADLSGNLTIGGDIDANGDSNFQGDITTQSKVLIAASGQGVFGAADGNTGIRWEGSDVLAFDTAGNERLTIDANGKLGIGVNDPESELEISGSTLGKKLFIDHTSSTANNCFGAEILFSAAAPNDATRTFIKCADNSATRASIRSNGGIANFQSNDADLSDETVKKDIVDAPNCLDKINQIKVRNFKYNDQTDNRNLIGVIAQEIESVDSSLVDSSEDLKRVYNKDIMFMMLKAIQELSVKVEALEG
tara:strand:+ start:3946 stop:4974 length:1029 start_codon:yes stop_codon:yes gene_type:complete